LLWFSGSISGCGVRGRRLRQPLRCTVLGTDCAPFLQCLGWLSLLPSMGRHNEYQLSRWAI